MKIGFWGAAVAHGINLRTAHGLRVENFQFYFLHKIVVISGKFWGEICFFVTGVNDFKFCVHPGIRISNFSIFHFSRFSEFSISQNILKFQVPQDNNHHVNLRNWQQQQQQQQQHQNHQNDVQQKINSTQNGENNFQNFANVTSIQTLGHAQKPAQQGAPEVFFNSRQNLITNQNLAVDIVESYTNLAKKQIVKKVVDLSRIGQAEAGAAGDGLRF